VSALVVGGTGQTGAATVNHLRARGVAARVATRAPKGPDEVRFVWEDPATHDDALHGVRGVYLVLPPAASDPLPIVAPFVTRALEAGVQRFVMLGSSAVPESDRGIGGVERLLRERAPEWAALKPSWFMQNFFARGHLHADTLREERRIYTATGDGRVAFVDTNDIGAVAATVLAAERAPNGPLLITGPEALSYADVAHLFGAEHVAIGEDEAKARLVAGGMNEEYAAMLVGLDRRVREGHEARVTDTVERLTERPAQSLRALVEARAGD